MRKLLCPQCKVSSMYVKNGKGERRAVYVTDGGVVVARKESETLDGFDLEKHRQRQNQPHCHGNHGEHDVIEQISPPTPAFFTHRHLLLRWSAVRFGFPLLLFHWFWLCGSVCLAPATSECHNR